MCSEYVLQEDAIATTPLGASAPFSVPVGADVAVITGLMLPLTEGLYEITVKLLQHEAIANPLPPDALVGDVGTTQSSAAGRLVVDSLHDGRAITLGSTPDGYGVIRIRRRVTKFVAVVDAGITEGNVFGYIIARRLKDKCCCKGGSCSV